MPTPWLSLALGTATGVMFAYAVQETGATPSEILDRLTQSVFLALS